jgi:cation diffusion facilitator CzcD-associated flavoprotein CzcO
MNLSPIKSVAIIGAGAAGSLPHNFVGAIIYLDLSGAITAAAFAAEDLFEVIRVFERRETPGGTW